MLKTAPDDAACGMRNNGTILKQIGAVASNSELSATVGINILENGGSAADAAIATLLMDGICNPHSMGIGGGFLCTYYNKCSGKIECLNAREYAPKNATTDMFQNGVTEGGLSVAVPGELKGYWELHTKYGKMKWKELFQPAINYCKVGIPVSEYSSRFMNRKKPKLMKSKTLSKIFIKDNGEIYHSGENIKRLHLAKTLELVASEGPEVLYNGCLTKNFLKDIQNEGGVITKEDMETYKAVWMEPVTSDLTNDMKVFSAPLPGSGSVVQLILNVIFGLKDNSTVDAKTKWSRIVETYKHAFGFRCMLEGPTKDTVQECISTMDALCIETIRKKVLSTKHTITDREFYSEECFRAYAGGGTCNICILAPNGDAACITSSINATYGAMFASPSTGIILNNHMMDFNINDEFCLNDVEPEKQPLSSMSPTIILDKTTNNVRLIVGSAGGTKIITTVTQIILEYLLYNVPLKDAIYGQRLHHQLMPMTLFFEKGFPHIEALRDFGHCTEMLLAEEIDGVRVPSSSSASVIGVNSNGDVEAYGDNRRDGFGILTKDMSNACAL